MKRRKVILAVLVAAAAVGLVCAGLFQLRDVYSRYREDMLAYESRHLNSVADSSGRGLEWMLEGYSAQAEAIMNRAEFRRAEMAYLSGDEPDSMEELMARPDVLRSDMSYSLAVYDAAGTFLASAGESFPQSAGEDEALGDTAVLRTGADGGFWLVFSQTSDEGFVYELAVRAETLLDDDAAQVGQGGYLFLLDRELRLFMCSDGEDVLVMSVDELASGYEGVEREALEELAQGVDSGPEDYRVYRYAWDDDGGGLFGSAGETLVVTCPLQTSGGDSLVMGAAVSFREFDSFLQQNLQQLAWVALMVAGGVLILLVLAVWLLFENRRKALELSVLTEKNALMEELNRQQQSLAHQERLQQLGVMTSGIAHEFNNLLTPIMSQSLLLLEQLADQEDSPQFENALDIYEASENARGILKRMSAMSKKDMDMDFRRIELGGLLRKTADMAAMAKDPHIQIQVAAEEGLFVSGSAQLLSQAFLNLLINACQAMKEGGAVTVTARRESAAYCRVEVCDTGPGIPEERLGSIYDPFFTTKGEAGTGLGLAICQKIIETHKGTISAANRPEGGAVFTVRLPLAEDGEERE